jgi:hypothetical protein
VNCTEPELAVELDAELEPALLIYLGEQTGLVIALGERGLEDSLEPKSPSTDTTRACPSCFAGCPSVTRQKSVFPWQRQVSESFSAAQETGGATQRQPSRPRKLVTCPTAEQWQRTTRPIADRYETCAYRKCATVISGTRQF